MLVGGLAGDPHVGSGAGPVPVRVTGVAGVEPTGRGLLLRGGAPIGAGLGGLFPCCGLFPCGAGLPLGYLGLAALGAGGVYLGLLPLLSGLLAVPLQLPATGQHADQDQQRKYDDRANDDPGDRSGIHADASSVGKWTCPWDRHQNMEGQPACRLTPAHDRQSLPRNPGTCERDGAD
jgi:hypothetical protein